MHVCCFIYGIIFSFFTKKQKHLLKEDFFGSLATILKSDESESEKKAIVLDALVVKHIAQQNKKQQKGHFKKGQKSLVGKNLFFFLLSLFVFKKKDLMFDFVKLLLSFAYIFYKNKNY